MSRQPRKKRTVAQLRAEKEQRERDFDEGFQLVEDLTYEAHDFKGTIVDVEARQDRLQAPGRPRLRAAPAPSSCVCEGSAAIEQGYYLYHLGTARFGAGRPPPR